MIAKKHLQKTLSKEISFEGIGLHTGLKTKIKLLPADEDTGIIFRRIDLKPNVEIPALASYVVNTDRGTTLGKENASIKDLNLNSFFNFFPLSSISHFSSNCFKI